MDAFTSHRGKLATLDRSNVDTDQIIPKQFLKSIKRTGYGPNAFFDWRYDENGDLDPGFELNHSRFEGRSILITRNNFGCGSSREHAVWALVQDGYKAIVAPSVQSRGDKIPGFADIFSNNAVKNGFLTVELEDDEVNLIFFLVQEHEGLEATIDLPTQTLTIHSPDPVTFSFNMDPGAKDRLVNGLDDITMSLTHEAAITEFEETHEVFLG